MIKQTIGRAACIFLLLIAGAFAAAAQSEWIEFSEDGGRTVGGTAIFVQHELKIVESDDGLVAMLQSNGYQTSKDIVAKARAEGARLILYFESYGENNVFETYAPGDLLLTLERKTVKGKSELLTHWNKFLPVVPKNEKSGKVYFKKVD